MEALPGFLGALELQLCPYSRHLGYSDGLLKMHLPPELTWRRIATKHKFWALSEHLWSLRQDAKRMQLTAGVVIRLLPPNYVLALLSALNRLQTKPLWQISIFSPGTCENYLLPGSWSGAE